MKATKVVKKLSKEEIKALVKNTQVSKSAKIRQLFDSGMDIKSISQLLQIRYNFAYNVLQNHVIQNGIAVEKSVRVSKRDDIVKLLKTGMSLADVSRKTKTNYNYIWKINKERKIEEEAKTTIKAEAAPTAAN
jgi:hypothetical protein